MVPLGGKIKDKREWDKEVRGYCCEQLMGSLYYQNILYPFQLNIISVANSWQHHLADFAISLPARAKNSAFS
jgi:hypothetical protein